MNRFNLSDWAIKHRSFVWYLMAVTVMAGMFSYWRLGRNEDPAFTVKTMVVQAQWPGATLDETIKQITDRIEKKLQETPSLDHIRSFTTAGQSTIFVSLKDATPARAVPDAWYQIRKKIRDIQPTLPQGTKGPFFDDDFGDTYAIIYGFTADGFTQRELRDRVEDVRSQLLATADVAKVDLFGTQDERIYIEFSSRQLAGLGADPQALIKAIRAQNVVTPAGVVQTGDDKIVLHVSGGFKSEADLKAVNFVANGRMFRLSDIAEIKRGYVDPPQSQFRVNGEPAIGLAISMTEGGDVLTLGKNIRKAMNEILRNLPIGIEPRLVADQSMVVSHAVGDFVEALWESIGIVLAVSLVILGLRAGAVVACAIPLVLTMVFVAMELLHIDLQRVSLGALIIALGLLVDDAMISVESMITKLEEGWDALRAATFAYTSTAFPMLTGTLVTVVGFVPVGFARSTAGEYTFSLFAVVAIALTASWFVAVIFAPVLGVSILPATLRRTSGPGRMMQGFRSVVTLAMRARYVTIAIALVLFGASAVGVFFVPRQFFPASDRPELLVDLQLPQNSSMYATEVEATKLDQLLKGDPDVDHWTTYVGRGALRFYLPLNVQLGNNSFAQLVVVTKNLRARERVRDRLEQTLVREFATLMGRVYPLELGPPVGWPLQYRISGPDPAKVRDLAYQLSQIVGSSPLARKVNFDWINPGRTVQVNVDQDQGRLLGISSEGLAQSINAVVSGLTITQIRDGIYLVDVNARSRDEERSSLASLRTLEIPIANGRMVPLSQVASFAYSQEPPLLWRRDRRPTLTVQAEVVPGVQPETVVEELSPKLAKFIEKLPAGYSVAVGGIAEESTKSQASVAAVVPLMLVLMLTILMVQLQSIARLILVLSVVPLGLIGVVGALLLSGQPLGFVAILGVIALSGMIVRNSVILIDQIDKEIAGGRSQWDAVVEASAHRLRPILLTAAAAILGMIPIAPTVFWGPMAYAMMGGLAVATTLTLVFLPALYCVWFGVGERASLGLRRG
jgi:multidrug efflux pump